LDPQLASEIEQAFEQDTERCVEIHLEDWRRRSIGQRAFERVSGLLGEQY
jgi:hypothetical protein